MEGECDSEDYLMFCLNKEDESYEEDDITNFLQAWI